jgi:DNA invertase Pin-like site-specific DNA recombinase
MTRQPTAFIYARVSRFEQNPQMQLRELRQYCKRRGWRIVGEYVDRGVSGSKDSRPQLDQLMRDCRKHLASSVVVYRYDRFARSLRHLVNALGEFDGLGVHFISLHEGVDTTTPNGRLVFGIFASIAEFERDLICQRIRSGLDLARAQGKRLGRPPVYRLSEEQIVQLKRERHKAHDSLRTLAKRYDVALWRVYALCSGKRTRV